MYAGVGANGAEDAWMDLAVLVEHWQLSGTPFVGGATDIVKCFDQIDRDLLLDIAQKAGMPTPVLNTHRAFMDQLCIHNTTAGGVCAPCARECGIPQGCPMSMMVTSMMLAPWIHRMEAMGIDPQSLSRRFAHCSSRQTTWLHV